MTKESDAYRANEACRRFTERMESLLTLWEEKPPIAAINARTERDNQLRNEISKGINEAADERDIALRDEGLEVFEGWTDYGYIRDIKPIKEKGK